MPPLPSRDVLESMKRVDLQRLCKDYGVRANLKSEALIDLLLETQSVRPAPSPQPPARRTASTRQSSRAGPSRTSSIIIHDIPDEQPDEDDAISNHEPTPAPQEPPAPSPAPGPSRTRKAKEIQSSLGVGRPKAVGGAGARTVTRAPSSQRSRRAKSSRMLSRVEPTIEEEPESIVVDGEAFQQGPSSSNGQPTTHNDLIGAALGGPSFSAPISSYIPSTPGPAGPSNPPPTSLPMPDLASQISSAVEPLRLQLEKMQLELRSLNERNVEILELKKQLSQLGDLQKKYTILQDEVQHLRSQSATLSSLQDEVKHLKEGMGDGPFTPQMPSTPKPRSPRIPQPQGVLPSAFKVSAYPPIVGDISPTNSPRKERSSSVPSHLPHPGLAATTLGKRPRDSLASDMTGILEDGEEEGMSRDELAKKVMRPKQKRPRLDSAEPAIASSSSHDVSAQLSAPRISSFTVYNDENAGFNESFIDAPPPTNGLPDFFSPSSPLGPGESGHMSPSQEENQQPFNFSFVPISSTPNPAGPTSFVAPFPFPDPPQSPSQPSTSLGYIGGSDHRTDIFKSFGFPSPRRPRLSESEDTVNPASIAGPSSSSGKQRATSTNDVAVGLWPAKAHRSSSMDPTSASDPPPAKRTMYGTELEGETRFGDFGVEGIASGFWSGR